MRKLLLMLFFFHVASLAACEEDYSSVVGDFQIYNDIPATAKIPQPDPKTPAVSTPPSSSSFDSNHFRGSQACATCHDEITDGQGNPVPIIKDWSSTMMANASRDPYWQAQVESEQKRAPALQSLLADKCTRCHMPLAHHETQHNQQSFKLFGPKGFLDSSHAFFDLAMSGVGCTLCHQIQKVQTPSLKDFSGGFQLAPFKAGEYRKIFGPFFDVETTPMQNNVGLTPVGSEHIRQSALCASCHNLKTAFVDKSGQVVPKTPEEQFPEQMTYTEWEASKYAQKNTLQNCQFCHMKVAYKVRFSFGPPWISERDYIRRHTFAGANLFMLRMLQENRDVLGIQANGFQAVLQNTQELLREGIALELVEKHFSNGRLQFKVKVINKAGHKYPTGYPSRRAFLNVRVLKDGKVLFESGKVLDNGHIVGSKGDLNSKNYEPHHERITRPDQVQIYESVMEDTDGEVTYTLLRAARYKKDNRLLPEGFDKQQASDDIKVVGQARSDGNFVGGSDIVFYDLKGFPDGKYDVEVHFRYQTISYPAAFDLFQDRSGPFTNRFLSMYLKSKSFADTIASLTFSL